MKVFKRIFSLVLTICLVLTMANIFSLGAKAEGEKVIVTIEFATGDNAPSDISGLALEYEFYNSSNEKIDGKDVYISQSGSNKDTITNEADVPSGAIKVKIKGVYNIGENNKATYNGSKINPGETTINLVESQNTNVQIRIEKDDNPGGQGGQQGPDGQGGQGGQHDNGKPEYNSEELSVSFNIYNERGELISGTPTPGEYHLYKNSDSENDLTVFIRAPYGNLLKSVSINGNPINDGIKSDNKEVFEHSMKKPDSKSLNIEIHYDVNNNITPNILWVYNRQTAIEKKFTGPNDVDCLVEHGKVKIQSVKLLEGTTVSYNQLIAEGENRNPNAWYDDGGTGTDGFGYAEIASGSTVTIEIIPDYGYQVSGANLNGCALTPLENVSTFSFVMGDKNLHLSAVFSPNKDTITNSSTEVSNPSITNGQNAANSGNLKLTVKDTTITEEAQSAAVAQVSGEDVSYVSSIDISLDNIVSKGTSTGNTENDYWTKNLTSFTNDITVSLGLENPGAGYTYDVVRNHEGTLTDLNATYQNGVLSVPTNQFSTYTIVKKKAPVSYSGYIPSTTADNNTNQETGNITNTTDSNTNAANFTLESDTKKISETILTDEEKESAKNGEKVDVSLKVVEIKNDIPVTEKTIIDNITTGNDLTVGTVFDISLFVSTNEESRQVTNTKGNISVSFSLPENLKNIDSSIKRVYGVLRIHNGVSTLLDAKYDATTNTISFETDRFSTYVLVYKDLGDGEETENITDITDITDTLNATDPTNNNTTEVNKDTVSGKVKSPKTGDEVSKNLLIVLMLITLLSALITFRHMNKE